MKKIDAGLDFIRHLAPKERLDVAAKVNYMASMAASSPGATPDETRIQVLIQVKNSSEPLNIQGVFVRSAVGNILSAQISPEAIEYLEMHPNVQYVERGAPLGLKATVEASKNVKIEVTPGPLSETGKGVIVGIIDWGCDFTHGDFRNENGSRILYFWDQTATPRGVGHPPSGYSGGVEFNKKQLDQALSQPNPFADLGIEPPDIGAHGTHVMGIAAGNGRESPNAGVHGIAPEADIIFVQPNTDDTNIIGGFGDSVNLAEAVKYIFEKASSLNKPGSSGFCGEPCIPDQQPFIEPAMSRLRNQLS